MASRNRFRSLRQFILATAGLAAAVSLAGCEKKRGEAIVLAKEHIAAREITETPGKDPESSPPAGEETETTIHEIGKDEIVVEQYVMRPEDRGTSRDPRATQHEQWRVEVQMVADGRRVHVQADRAQFDKLKEGDRVKVSYRVGKYTGAVWDATIE